MNTDFPTTHGWCRIGRARRPAWVPLLLAICIQSTPARAATEAEDAMNKAAMPHESLGARGAMVMVHLVSLHGYLQGRPDDATRLTQLHAEVEDCVRRNSARGIPSKPPRAWPDHVISSRIDSYSARNRTIRYSSSLAYSVNPLDCSLMETKNHTAHLFSSQGTCDIDLREQTAHGACDAAGQANARPPQRVPLPTTAQINAVERNAATNPAMAALLAAMRSHPPSGAGERKTVAGLECDVWPNPFDPGARNCLSRGGSFAAADVTGNLGQSGMALEMTSVAGVNMLATQAKLDALVNSAVFTPYLAGGFRITNTRTHP